MDLSALFGQEAITYEQFAQKVEQSGMTLADVSSGAYITAEEHERLLGDANNAAEQERQQLEQQAIKLKTQNAVDMALLKNGARDLLSVKAHLDMDSITLEEGDLIGLDEQLEKIRQHCGFLFGGEEIAPKAICTGIRLSSGMEHRSRAQLDPSKLTDSEYYEMFGKRQ